jgi:uncharacterized integral membrane protein
VSISVAIIFLVLLIIFIAQNDRKVPLHFFGASGHVSEALALIVAAVAGAMVVLLVGVARIIQLRLGGRRHNQRLARQAAADSAAAAPAGEAQSVNTKD